MLSIVPHDAKFDFVGKATTMRNISIAAFIGALVVIFILPLVHKDLGLKLGLDFSGGHEILVGFKKSDIEAGQVRAELAKLDLGDTSVQSYNIPDVEGTHFLVRVQRAEVLGKETIDALEETFKGKYGDTYKAPLTYNKGIGSVIEVEFTVSGTVATSTQASNPYSPSSVREVAESTGHKINNVKKIGRPDQAHYQVTLAGVDASVVEGLKALDPDVQNKRVEFVGPTVGKQLRDDGILAVFYALLCILVYVALRFDFFYSPGAIACLFHDAVITVGILSLLGHEFSLTTIAGVLTLVGYSINDTIVVFDRIRETVGKVQGKALGAVVNRALNETLGRTLLTSITTFGACICMCVFGQKTVLFDFGLILAVGVIIGTYSTVFVATPLFMFLRDRFGPKGASA